MRFQSANESLLSPDSTTPVFFTDSGSDEKNIEDRLAKLSVTNGFTVNYHNLSGGSRKRASTVVGQNSVHIPTRSKIFLLVVMIEVLIIIAERVIIDVYLSWNHADNRWLFGLLCITTSFMLYFALDAIYNECYGSFYTFYASSILVTVREILEFSLKDDACNVHNVFPWCLSLFMVLILFHCAYLIMMPWVYKKLGWRYYKKYGSDARIKEIHDDYELFVTLSIFDFQMILLLLFTIGYFMHDNLKVLIFTIIAASTELILRILLIFAVRKEFRGFSFGLVFLILIAPVYVVYFLIQANSYFIVSGISQNLVFRIIVFVCLEAVSRLALLICSIRSIILFGKGLKELVFEKVQVFIE